MFEDKEGETFWASFERCLENVFKMTCVVSVGLLLLLVAVVVVAFVLGSG